MYAVQFRKRRPSRLRCKGQRVLWNSQFHYSLFYIFTLTLSLFHTRCQRMHKVAKRSLRLPKVAKGCQKLTKVAKKFQKLPEVSKSCQKLPEFVIGCQKGSPITISVEGIWALPNGFCTPPSRTQPGTLEHFISEKSAPNHPGKGWDPPPLMGNAQMPSAWLVMVLP